MNASSCLRNKVNASSTFLARALEVYFVGTSSDLNTNTWGQTCLDGLMPQDGHPSGHPSGLNFDFAQCTDSFEEFLNAH